MGRPRRQEPRREQLLNASLSVLARDGLGGFKVREVAREAGMSPGSVLYYYPDFFELALHALRHGVLAAATDRAAIAASVADPARRLAALVAHHLPGRGTGLHRALAEIPAHAADHPELAAVAMVAIEDRVDAFVAALDDGVRSGAFRPVAPVEVLARGLVAQLDAAAAYQAAGIETPAATTDSILGHLAAVLACPAVLDGAARRPVPAGLRGAEVPASGPPETHDVGVALRS